MGEFSKVADLHSLVRRSVRSMVQIVTVAMDTSVTLRQLVCCTDSLILQIFWGNHELISRKLKI